ncbi:hypothetical protein GDO81_029675 [Engystomops pustulosus]|uniref:Uncharacterized protein n=1 Tax=Engystomops pustulosus TaxID=76066 RepID=A0AAV6YZ57_ENGPU|nr:hypothetical protein GDO81_029675 [Engystomops pustulosus]
MVTKPEKWRRTSADFRGRGSEMANMDEETRNKFKRIKSILEEAKPVRKTVSKLFGHKPEFGIVAHRGEDVRWLHEALSSNYFSDIIMKIRHIDTSDSDTMKLVQKISVCSFCFFIFSGCDQVSAMRWRIENLLGKRKLS